ncbi:HAD family hydrolase [Roseinatronobacter alkalisoli]|uniref:phosphoglycolate phosphatase n=1 Tax=Roseinatronobacter alkalisoli TaxID=3028235 RepID=A0ABT5T5H8_9RHOB|nr:HAD family hydrolase [Roseinatronobacter sp. HJB301]MDD7970375.1 HAD family hydrolase [Roseinatronobacter sp. HJB301]
MKLTGISALLFDKDGTLFDFSASWAGWVSSILDDLSEGNAQHADAMAESLHFDRQKHQFAPTSPVIAGTVDDAARLLGTHLPHMPRPSLVAYLCETSAMAPMIPPVPLVPLLTGLQQRGLILGVATNDGEMPARAHLTRAGILHLFSHVLGYDSGFTPKPDPAMLLGYAGLAGVAPETVVMVGDSTHDLVAGRAAGMTTIGVLTGLASADDLAPFADIVLPDIGHLPDILA